MGLLPESIGIGLVVIFAFGELFGLTAGGMVVPGYLALQLDQPLRVVGTLFLAGLVFVLMRGAKRLFLLYGRRRFVLTVMVGFLLGLIGDQLFDLRLTATGEARAIGFVLPGLIAHTMESQGPVITLGALVSVTILTRLILVAAFGPGVHF